jgi:aryl-alcohol dehydrogenase-like predicted oxidoreductase
LGGGVLTGKYTRGDASDSLRKRGNEQHGRTGEQAMTIARAVDAVADELGVSSAQVALAWVAAQGYGFIPIAGARKVAQIQDSMGFVNVTLEDSHLATLGEASAVSLGFPHDFLAADGVKDLVRTEGRGRIVGRRAGSR